MNAFRQDLLPPSGVEYAVSLKFTPFARGRYPTPGGGEVVANLVVARQNLLRVFDVRVEAAPLPTQAQVLAGDHGRSRRGMDTVEGEVQMDVGGEGFVSVAAVKVHSRANILCLLPIGVPLLITMLVYWSARASGADCDPTLPRAPTSCSWHSHRPSQGANHRDRGRWFGPSFSIVQRCKGMILEASI